MLVTEHSMSLRSIEGEGCGNTFLIYDCLDIADFKAIMPGAQAALLESKRDDALILVKVKENDSEFVLRMIVLEPDGSLAEFCGNGARVVASYLKHRLGNSTKNYFLKTSTGHRRLWWEDDNYFVDMGKTTIRGLKSLFVNALEPLKLGLGLKSYPFYLTETMEPHLVTFEAISEKDLHDLGEYVNKSQRDYFPLGININQASIIGEGLKVITYERGVNKITAACGTGATSSAWLAHTTGRLKTNFIKVEMKGGNVDLYLLKDKTIMSGPAHVRI